ncbi:MAG TPA: DUF4232 domain-containing protein [Acidimicrobiales bacterium]|nr:DUF4232 domain-containing protein [Acidimicrobiales bacterium]
MKLGEAMSRSRAIAASVALLTASVTATLLLSPVNGAAAGIADSPGSVLTNTSLGGYTQLGQVDMLSPTLGYALAAHPLSGGRYAYYLVRTSNLTTWIVASRRLFVDDSLPNLADFPGTDSDPSIDFVNRDVGYVAGPNNGIYMTINAGATWRQLPTAGSYGISGSTLSVVNARCTRPGTSDDSCVNTLNEYHVGAATPYSTTIVPHVGARSDLTVLLAVASGPTQVVNLDNDSSSTPSSLLITHDGGAEWSALANPCNKYMIEQLAVARDGEWLLSCFMDQGMYQGPAKVLSSTNDGTTWHTVLNEVHGTSIYYFFSANDRVIFGASTNPAGGLSESTDGGRTWDSLSVLGNTGGAPESVSNFGPTSSLYQVYQGPMYTTHNGRTWTLLPPLPAGTFDGLAICTRRTVSATLHRFKAGGLHYAYIDFTNTTKNPCYLDGVPSVQPLDAKGRDVGPALTTEVQNRDGDFVILKHRGSVAGMPFTVNPPSSYPLSAHCDGRRATSVVIHFSSPSEFKVSLKSPKVSVCTTFQGVFTTQVRLGRGLPPSY